MDLGMTGADGAESSEPKGADVAIPDATKVRLAEEIEKEENYIEKYDQQMQDIERERKLSPLVGEKKPFGTVQLEYDPNESPEFYFKAEDLANTYEWFRPIRRDGNCFYRAILTAQVERIYKDPDELKRFDFVCRGWLTRLLKLGFPEMTTTDFCEAFYEFLDKIKKKEGSFEWAFQQLNKDENSNYYIIFLRLVASAYLKEHSEEYAPFVDGGLPLSDYCEQEIESMWKDVDHLAILGLVNALGISIRVEYLDQTAAPHGAYYYDVPPDPKEPPPIVLLYRPGHYDLIYRK